MIFSRRKPWTGSISELEERVWALKDMIVKLEERIKNLAVAAESAIRNSIV